MLHPNLLCTRSICSEPLKLNTEDNNIALAINYISEAFRKGFQCPECLPVSPRLSKLKSLQALREDKSQASICREHNLSPDIVTRWKQAVEEHAYEIFDVDVKTSGNDERILEL